MDRHAIDIVTRAEHFLVGVACSRRIEQLLAQQGFCSEDFEEGMHLYMLTIAEGGATRGRYAQELAGWHARWARVARRVLRRRTDLATLGIEPPPAAPAAVASLDVQKKAA